MNTLRPFNPSRCMFKVEVMTTGTLYLVGVPPANPNDICVWFLLAGMLRQLGKRRLTAGRSSTDLCMIVGKLTIS